jgi:hypothetical protein
MIALFITACVLYALIRANKKIQSLSNDLELARELNNVYSYAINEAEDSLLLAEIEIQCIINELKNENNA